MKIASTVSQNTRRNIHISKAMGKGFLRGREFVFVSLRPMQSSHPGSNFIQIQLAARWIGLNLVRSKLHNRFRKGVVGDGL